MIGGAFAHNPETKELGLLLAPSCQRQVKMVCFDSYTGEVTVYFADDNQPTPFGYFPESFDVTAHAVTEVLVAHTLTMDDFEEMRTCEEYPVPFFAD